MKRSFVLLFLTSLASGMAMAGSLTAPFALTSAKVLPQGVRNLNYKGLLISGTEKFNDAGSSVVLADPFFNDVTLGKILDAADTGAERGKISQKMWMMGVSEDDKIAETIGQVNVAALANVPVFAWGITEKITAAIAVPVTRASVNVDTGMKPNRELYDKFLDAISSTPASQVDFNEKMGSIINTKLSDNGYKPLENETATKLGDVKLVGKYQVFQNVKNAVVLGADVTLPTGDEEDPDKVINLPGGDGQADFGVSVAYDYNLTPSWSVVTSVGYTVQFADKAVKRIPEEEDSTISPDKESVDRNLGDIFNAQVGLKFSQKGFTVGAGYNFQDKQKDTYQGTAFEGVRYDWLAKDSDQQMHAAQLTLGFDTISLYRQKKFAVPLSVGVTHAQVLSGKNVVKDPMTTLDLSLFF